MNRDSTVFAGVLLAVSATLAGETRSYRGVEITLLSAKAGEMEYRIGTYVRKADRGKELVILEFRFDAGKVPKQQKVSLGHLRVVGSAGEELGDSQLGTVEGGASFPLAGQDVILQVPAGSRPKTAVINVDEGEALTFQLDQLLKFLRGTETAETKVTTGDRILDDRVVGKGRINGVLVAASGTPETDKEVLLVEVEVYDLTGKKVAQIPAAMGTVIIDVGSTKLAARTDKSGRFEFKEVPGGRYGVCLGAKLGGTDKRGPFLQHLQNGGTVLFDLADGQQVDFGKVSPKPERQ